MKLAAWLAIGILGAMSAVAAVPARSMAQDPAGLLASGRTAFEAGRYEKAKEDLWAYLDATASLSGASRLPQAEALFYIGQMETDAAVAAQHYQTIVEEYPASTIADEALFRLGVYTLVTGNPAEARTRFVELRQNYPFSRFQGEIPLWVGRTFLAERSYSAATTTFIEGFARVRTQDLPYELAPAQRDALAAEYAYWLATAFAEEGDRETAMQYWSLLALDYASAPQAAEARAALANGGRPVETTTTDFAMAAAPVSEEPVYEPPAEEPAYEPPAEEPAYEPPAEEPAYEPPPAAAVYVPPAAQEPPREEPVVREPPREEPVVREPPREEPAAPTRRPDDEDVFKFPPAGGARPGPGGAGTAYLQIGAFTSAASAADLSKRLREDGFSSAVEIEIRDGQGYYRVRVGPYRMPIEESALRATEDRLQRMGYPSQRVAVGS